MLLARLAIVSFLALAASIAQAQAPQQWVLLTTAVSNEYSGTANQWRITVYDFDAWCRHVPRPDQAEIDQAGNLLLAAHAFLASAVDELRLAISTGNEFGDEALPLVKSYCDSASTKLLQAYIKVLAARQIMGLPPLRNP